MSFDEDILTTASNSPNKKQRVKINKQYLECESLFCQSKSQYIVIVLFPKTMVNCLIWKFSLKKILSSRYSIIAVIGKNPTCA
jgi:hypothetical protein